MHYLMALSSPEDMIVSWKEMAYSQTRLSSVTNTEASHVRTWHGHVSELRYNEGHDRDTLARLYFK
jgi:hypothetical protein